MSHLFRLRAVLLLPSSRPTSLRLFSTTAAVANAAPSAYLSPDHLISQANLLLPRLCRSNHLPDAIRLLAAVLPATSPNLLPSFSVLVDHLTSHSSMADSMALINRLRHSPATQSSLPPVTLALIDSYLSKQRPKEALKLLNWMLRPDSVSPPDGQVFRVLVSGLFNCRAGLEGLKALREMLRTGFGPEPELRAVVYRGLLRVVLVREARALDEALLECVAVDGGDGFQRALKLLDEIISQWED